MRTKSITLNDNGAVMVMAVFVAILMVGLLYHVAGVGGASMEKQLMQDGADAAAFSAATVNARGMNILAMLNLIMVALLTILVALKLVQAILVVILIIVSVACAVPPYVGCALIAPLEVAQSDVKEAAEAYQEVAKAIIEGLTEASSAINEVVPIIALAEGYNIATSAPYNKVTKAGVVWPIFDGLPTKKGSYSELCKRAGKNITYPIELILPPGVGDIVGATLGELISELTETFTSYFCGDDGNGNQGEKPKKKKRKEEVAYPPGQPNKKEDGMQGCVETHPQESNGKCLDEKCKECAELACNFCFPKMKSDKSYKSGVWTIVKNHFAEWTEIDEHGAKKLVKVPAKDNILDTWSIEKVSQNPCRNAGNTEPSNYYTNGCAGYPNEWAWSKVNDRRDRVPSKEEYSPRPVCEIAKYEDITSQSDIAYYLNIHGDSFSSGGAPLMRLVKQTLYVALSTCIIEEEIEIEAQGDSIHSSDDDEGSMAPRVLDPERFPDEAEIKSILYGVGKASHRKQGVAIADKNADTSGGTDKRFSFAAAEYYSMDSDQEAMWHMRWLSRLVRFQLSTSDSGDSQEQTGSDTIDSNNQQGFDLASEAMDSFSADFGEGADFNDFLLH